MKLNHTWKVFLQLLRRDIYIQRQQFKAYAVNYALIYPITFSLQTAYLQANSYFGTGNPEQNTILFAGNILLVIMLFTYKQNIELLFDLENNRFIDYQMTLINPFFILLEKILFTGCLTFILTLPFYPIAKLLFPHQIVTTNANWLSMIVILFFGSLCCSAYHLMAACILKKPSSISTLWHRVNGVMLVLGGLWVPWIVIYTFSPILGYLVYINPLIYISDGVKYALLASNEFIPVYICLPLLSLFTVAFTITSWRYFKRRVDCL